MKKNYTSLKIMILNFRNTRYLLHVCILLRNKRDVKKNRSSNFDIFLKE